MPCCRTRRNVKRINRVAVGQGTRSQPAAIPVSVHFLNNYDKHTHPCAHNPLPFGLTMPSQAFRGGPLQE